MWGWTPYVDPDTMLSYFTCDQVASDPEDPTNYYNDANWCDPEYDKLYEQQKVELDPDKRMQQVHEMLTRFYESATYVPLYLQADLQAYRKDKFDGLGAPAGRDRARAVLQQLAELRDAQAGGGDDAADGGGGGDDGGGGAGLIIGIGAVVLLGAVGLVVAMRRRGSADERE